jgi:hypothetical protein
LSSWSPSCREGAMLWRYVSGVAYISDLREEKLVTGLFPRSTPRMGHLPPFDFWRSWCSSVNVLL